jgi:ABC-type transport system substrate-binding protein
MPLWSPSYEGTQAGAVLSKAHFDREGVEGIRNKPIGAGSFKFVQRSRGEFIKLEAFADHYCCVPGFKQLTVLDIPELTTRLALLKTGGADLIEAALSVKKDIEGSGFRIIAIKGALSAAVWYMYQDLPKSPFNDKRVREALSIAIDKNAITQRLYSGEGAPTPSFFSGPGSFGFAADLPGHPYDPARAKQLMKDAGYAKGFKVRVVTYSADADMPDLPTLAQAVLGYLQELGIDGTVQIYEWNALKDEIDRMLRGVCGGKKLACTPEAAVNPGLAGQEPYTLIVRGNDTRYNGYRQALAWYHTTARRPVIQLPEVDAALDAVGVEFDLSRQRALFEDYNRMMNREYRMAFLVYTNAVFGVSKKIASWEPITGRTYPNNQWSLKPAK